MAPPQPADDRVPAPAEPPAVPYHSALPAASLWRRLVALLYDGLLLLAIAFAYAAAVVTVQVQLLGYREAAPMGWSALLGLWFCASLYYVWCWRRSGQTLGMKTWRLRLQQGDGGPPSRARAWLRCLLAPLALVSVVGYLWCLWSRSGDCLHDRWSGTRVVLLPRRA